MTPTVGRALATVVTVVCFVLTYYVGVFVGKRQDRLSDASAEANTAVAAQYAETQERIKLGLRARNDTLSAQYEAIKARPPVVVTRWRTKETQVGCGLTQEEFWSQTYTPEETCVFLNSGVFEDGECDY